MLQLLKADAATRDHCKSVLGEMCQRLLSLQNCIKLRKSSALKTTGSLETIKGNVHVCLPWYYPFPPIHLWSLWETGCWTRWTFDMTKKGYLCVIQWKLMNYKNFLKGTCFASKIYSLLPQNSSETGVLSCFLMSQCWLLKVTASHT